MEFLFFFKQKTAYEMRISDWSSDVCSSDLREPLSAALNATYCLFHRTARRTNRRNTLSREAHLTMQDRKRDEERRARLAHPVILIALTSVMAAEQTGKASDRERGCKYVKISVVGGSLKEKYYTKAGANL